MDASSLLCSTAPPSGEARDYITLQLVQCVVHEAVHAAVGAPHPAPQLPVFLQDAAKNRLQVVVFLLHLFTFGHQGSDGVLQLHPSAPSRPKMFDVQNESNAKIKQQINKQIRK